MTPEKLSKIKFHLLSVRDTGFAGEIRIFWEDVADLVDEVERLKRGEFTEEEFQNLCHNLTPNDRTIFEKGCRDYQAKLFGTQEK